jgi:hypothetical protein
MDRIIHKGDSNIKLVKFLVATSHPINRRTKKGRQILQTRIDQSDENEAERAFYLVLTMLIVFLVRFGIRLWLKIFVASTVPLSSFEFFPLLLFGAVIW